jgi:hypothetical protein
LLVLVYGLQFKSESLDLGDVLQIGAASGHHAERVEECLSILPEDCVYLHHPTNLIADYAHHIVHVMPLLPQLTQVTIECFIQVLNPIAPLMHSSIAKITVDYWIAVIIVREIAA